MVLDATQNNSKIKVTSVDADDLHFDLSTVTIHLSTSYVELYAKPRSLNNEQCRFGDGSTLFGGYKLVGI